MTVKYFIDSMAKKHNKYFSTEEKELLGRYFGDSDRIDSIIYTSEGLILRSLVEDQLSNCFILHSDGSVNKIPPQDDEKVWFGLYMVPHTPTYILVKKL